MNLSFRSLAFLFFTIFLVQACSEPDSVGIELLGEDQPGVFVTDTITLDSKTIREDSLRSDEYIAGFNLAGSYTDPVFGLTSASFYSEIRLPNNNSGFTFGTAPALDSVVLTLAYADFYGDTLTPLNMEVYQNDGILAFDSSYYTNDTVALKRTLFNGSVNIRPKDSILVDGALRAPHLRMRLDDTFGTEFINAPSTSFADNDAFITYFNGIHVRSADITASGQGVIASFNMLASMSKLTFYYKNGTDTTRRVANFEINSGCPRFNHFVHDYSGSQIGSSFPVSGNNQLYVQSMSGVKCRVLLPFLKNFSMNGPVAINKAELIIPVTDNGTYKNHNNLLLFGVDSTGKEAIIPDLLEASSYYGGSYDAITKSYRFNINRYVQKVVSGSYENDYGLSIISSGGPINSFRTIIPGTSTLTGEKIRLRITYSKLN